MAYKMQILSTDLHIYFISKCFLRRNSNSTLRVLKNVANTSINAISSSQVRTRKSNSLKSIPRHKYNSAYARLLLPKIPWTGAVHVGTRGCSQGKRDEIKQIVGGGYLTPLQDRCPFEKATKYCSIPTL